MFKNHFLSIIRNTKKNILFSGLNITGLSIGIATALVITLFIIDEFKYDQFHVKGSSIYRIAMYNGEDFHNPLTPMPLGPLLSKEFPEIKDAVRIYKNRTNSQLIKYNEKAFYEKECIYADSSFFNLFSFPLLQGNPNTALTQPNTVVITESAAHKYFGEEDPVGKLLQVNNKTSFQVTGVMKDIPRHSHLHFDFLFSFASMEQQHKDNWLIPFMFTYILVPDKIAAKNIEPKLTAFAVQHMNPQIKEALGISFEQLLKKDNQQYRLYLQGLTDIHLRSNLKVELEPNGDIKNIYIFGIVAFLVLLLACINFINLFTAMAASRTKEISVRKMIGATHKQLIKQFLLESIFYCFVATSIALVIVIVGLPYINILLGKNISLPDNILLWLSLLLFFTLVIGTVSGSYPAFYLSRIQPMSLLKKFSIGKSFDVRKILVVTQFIICCGLIICISIIYQQLDYMQKKDLGFDKDQLVTIPIRGSMDALKKSQLKNELLQNPSVLDVTMANYAPGEEAYENQDIFLPENSPSKQGVPLWYINGDFDFAKTMKISFIAGRNFSENLLLDSSAYLINETAAKQLGWTAVSAIGKKISSFDGPGKTIPKMVIGVIKDFQFENFTMAVKPMIIGVDPHYWRKYIVRLNPRNISNTLAFLKVKWAEYRSEYPFEYTFLDDSFGNFWQKEKVLVKLASVFTTIAIIIACLGLFALSIFISNQRIKEIGIRKILGASVANIISLFSKDFLKLIFIAFMIAAPIAWYTMHNWLQNFAYRIDISWQVFLFSGCIALLIALVTISFQAIKTAVINPIKNLRSE